MISLIGKRTMSTLCLATGSTDTLNSQTLDLRIIDFRRTHRIQNHWRGCFTSVFAYLHNETSNIYCYPKPLHISQFFQSTSTAIYGGPCTTWADSAVFAVFLSSAIFCLSASAFYHTATCHSKRFRRVVMHSTIQA
ncbi:hypothetical protein B0H10DRAFT_935835 [Mycena sp. CBHHK59/15]|nr:hypothetical protein B0H10DRAFT_935835 [Mycena sp. CBHHK59/15]